MGGICAKISALDSSPDAITIDGNGFGDSFSMAHESYGKAESIYKTMPLEETVQKQSRESTFSRVDMSDLRGIETVTGKQQLCKTSSHKSKSTGSESAVSGNSGMTKASVFFVSEVSSLLGRAGTVGLGKAVDVLDMLGSSMISLKSGSSFMKGVTTKGEKISILAFEVANSVVKGANLMQSLSRENIKHLKEVVLPSEGVLRMVSNDMDELLQIAAADKREELKVFVDEVVRFGNRCKDPQWHNLDRCFAKFDSELTPQKQMREKALGAMQYLMTLVRYTADLYHEMYDLGRSEKEYQRRLQDKIELPVQRGDSHLILREELKSQHKNVKFLKKKSFWSKSLEEVMAKLMVIVHFLYLEIHATFQLADGDKHVGVSNVHQRLGQAGLALHYANVITQIVALVSQSSSVPPSTRHSLYQGLPPSVKSALRSKLQFFQFKEELTVPQIKCEMEKTLHWLFPIAINTIRAHQGFGWVGEWAKTRIELNQIAAAQTGVVKIETLYHADKAKTETYILDLVVWLHHLTVRCRPGNAGFNPPVKSPSCSPATKRSSISSPVIKPIGSLSKITSVDQEMLRDVNLKKPTPGIRKSQEFGTCGPTTSKQKISSSHSTTREYKEFSPTTVVSFDINRKRALRIPERVDRSTNLRSP
ncbi:unnamed protein product [Musa acuminata subsp. burmannicoides]